MHKFLIFVLLLMAGCSPVRQISYYTKPTYREDSTLFCHFIEVRETRKTYDSTVWVIYPEQDSNIIFHERKNKSSH